MTDEPFTFPANTPQVVQQGLRNELLEMTKTIAQTHAEVTEIKPETVARGKFEEPAPNAATDVVAAAERLQDLAWSMREHGLDMTTCEQIETLASTILSASSLRDPGDRRAQKLGEALRYLERRIDSMIESTAERAKVASAQVPARPLDSSQQPLSEAHPTDAAGEPEPADFLFEPLPTPLRDRVSAESKTVAAPTPEPAPVDATANIDDGLFATLTAPVPEAAPTLPAPLQSATIGLPIESTPATTISSTLQRPSDSPSWSPAKPMPRPTPSDPLAALNAMSDDERIALFT